VPGEQGFSGNITPQGTPPAAPPPGMQ
jgi:hypothetical protein